MRAFKRVDVKAGQTVNAKLTFDSKAFGGISQNYYKYICHYITPELYAAASKYVAKPEEYDFHKILNWK